MTIKTNFTPGPWRTDYKDHNGQQVVSATYYEIATCWHHSVGSIEKEMESNAHLIAQSPAMYLALEATNRELNAAIEKINEMLRARISSTDLQPPDYWDQQTVQENEMLLAKARGEA